MWSRALSPHFFDLLRTRAVARAFDFSARACLAVLMGGVAVFFFF